MTDRPPLRAGSRLHQPADQDPRRRDAVRDVRDARLADRRRDLRSGRVRLGDHRPRARRRRTSPSCWPACTPSDRRRPRPSSDRVRQTGCESGACSTSAPTGVMIPRIDLPGAGRARSISFMRYPPDGTRGLALSTRGAGLGELGHADVRAINEQIVGIIQIESPSAVEHAAEIAAIDGVDVLFVGPADLSHSLGIPGQFDDPRFLAALERRRGARRKPHGKAAGILLYDMAVAAAPPSSSGSGSSGSARTARSSPMGPGPCWRAPAADVARHVAFLRAINVGGHTVKMADLRRSFEALGFDAVETFIASGNVIFDADAPDRRSRRSRGCGGPRIASTRARAAEIAAIAIESCLACARPARLTAIVGHVPPDRRRSPVRRHGGRSIEVRGSPAPWLARSPRLEPWSTAIEDAARRRRTDACGAPPCGEIGTSRFSGGLLEKTLGMPATARGATPSWQMAKRSATGPSGPPAATLLVRDADRGPRRAIGRGPGLGDQHADEDQRAADQLHRRQRHAEQERGERDRPDRLDRADQRGLGRADPLRPGVEGLDRDERRQDADADQPEPGLRGDRRRAGPAGRCRGPTIQ